MPPRPSPRRAAAFSITEVLVALSVVAVLVGVILPTVAHVRQQAVKTTCSGQLQQLGQVIDAHRADHHDRYPAARYMPDPFVTGDSDPPLPQVLEPYLAHPRGPDGRALTAALYHCPGDTLVHPLAGTSFMYRVSMAGQTLAESQPARRLGLSPAQVALANDFDGATFDTTRGPLTVPSFHGLRNFLFADGHVGNY